MHSCEGKGPFKHVKYHKLLFATDLFSAVIQNPTEKPQLLFGEKTRVMLTFISAHKKMSSLHHSAVFFHTTLVAKP